MEEKERYKLESYNEAFCQIHDTESDEWYLRKDLVKDLLNQQDKKIKELEEENQQLKQQLNDLPKKIVGEIEKNFTEYLPLKDKTGAGFYCRLNAILEKYGGENE